jgi:hypothetical protein
MVSAATLRINQDLGAVVKRDKKKPAADGFLVLVKNRVAGAQVNVFFVWECEKEGSAGETDGYAQIAVSKNEPVNCMVVDSLGASFEKVVAHEVGHNLGLKDDYTNPRLLMYGKTGKANGMLLTKTEIKTINP